MNVNMKKGVALVLPALLCISQAIAQSIHFSQYYNAPMLLNPANTALLPENDFRVGLNYRNQWATLPVPYSTFSAFADAKLFKTGEMENAKWLGIGAVLFNDVAGDGKLSFFKSEAFIAYHLSLSAVSMLSAGLSAGMVQRSVDYNNLTFDAQWDDQLYTFNPANANHEQLGIVKTNYNTIGAGINFAYYPYEAMYLKIGAGATNLNQPNESFYGKNNILGIKGIANIDLMVRTAANLVVNPSVYFAAQQGAYELVYGVLFQISMADEKKGNPVHFIIGGYNRWNDAIIAAVGLQWSNLQFMANYDFTISSLEPYNNGNGATEFSLIYQGIWPKSNHGRRTYNCPRFF